MRLLTLVVASLLLLAAPATTRSEDSPPPGPGDARVVEFFLPGQFLEARMRAMETNRALLITGVAPGMDAEGAKSANTGTWGAAGDVLRGGPLAERRVIDLINRRFVPFYFNVGKGQPGFDESAATYIAAIDDRFAGDSVPTPPVWIVSPEGELFTTIDNFTDKHAFHSALVKVLDEHYEMGLDAPEETAVLDAPTAAPGSAGAWLAAGRLQEELGRDDAAKASYERVAAIAEKASGEHLHAQLGRVRLERWARDWDATVKILLDVRLSRAGSASGDAAGPGSAADEVSMEMAYTLLGHDQEKRALVALEEAIERHPTSRRLGEMHFYAGVAAFRLGRRDVANYHWCWVLENLPDDHNFMRCHLAATADAMPYPNPELDGYKGDVKGISHAAADAARAKAMADYERLKKED